MSGLIWAWCYLAHWSPMNKCLRDSQDVLSLNQKPPLLKAPQGNFREPANHRAPYFTEFPSPLGCDWQHWPACSPLCTLTSLLMVKDISSVTSSPTGREFKKTPKQTVSFSNKIVDVAVYPCSMSSAFTWCLPGRLRQLKHAREIQLVPCIERLSFEYLVSGVCTPRIIYLFIHWRLQDA